MIKNQFIIVTALLSLIVPLTTVSTAETSTPDAAVTAETVVNPILEEAHALIEAGKLTDARERYKEYLEDEALSESEAEKIRKEYEDLNVKILFSKTESDESSFYEVKPGDNLTKIAKMHKTTIALIKKSNGLEKDVIRPGMKLKILSGRFSVEVDKSENTLTLLLDDEPFKHYKVATGVNNGTPEGEYKVTTKLENPTWYKTGAVVPPNSPENGLGTRWIGIDKPGYGIHGTIAPETIGQQVSHGCVRMMNSEVEELYMLLPLGTEIVIVD